MRKARIAAVALLAVLTSATARTRVATVHYIPPPEPGDIFTVIDFDHSGGEAQPMQVTESMAQRQRSFTAIAPYSCAQSTPTGVVVRFRHFTADSTPLNLSTTGTIIRGPFQGDMPMEALHHCYRLMS
jgi:hypothetical protein